MGLLLVSDDRKLQVHPGKIRLSDNVFWVLYVKDVANLVLGCLGGCSSQTYDSGIASKFLFDHLMQNQVSRSEIVTPL